MMTVAAIDRIIHHATIIELDGDSYRRKQVRGSCLPSDRSLTATEVKKLHRVCFQDKSPARIRDYSIIATLLTTGLSRSEIFNIDIEDYNTRTGLLNILTGKGNKQRTTYPNILA